MLARGDEQEWVKSSDKDRGHRTDWILGMKEREEARKMLGLCLGPPGGERSHLWGGDWEGGEDESRCK